MKKLILLYLVTAFCWFQVVHGAQQAEEWSVQSDQDLSGLIILLGNSDHSHSIMGSGSSFCRLQFTEIVQKMYSEEASLKCLGACCTPRISITKEDWKNLPPPPSFYNNCQTTLLKTIVFTTNTRISA